ncbi:hypothetical protein [Vibrio vulnificus]|uniref:hypothetical protein n=1 Tax=Vibrio vulnificus TaxID=672 RepID=UPI003242AC90
MVGPFIAIVLSVHFGAVLVSQEHRLADFYNTVNQTIIEDYRRISEGHKEFANLYKMCKGVVTEKLDSNCINIAATALKNEHNINEIISNFYELDIPSPKESIGFWDWINPLEVYPALLK